MFTVVKILLLNIVNIHLKIGNLTHHGKISSVCHLENIYNLCIYLCCSFLSAIEQTVYEICHRCRLAHVM